MAITRNSITLPSEVSNEILQTMQEQSVVMRLARQIPLPGRGVTIPVITGDPEAAWVAEGGAKPVSNPTLSQKLMTAYKLAVIVPFSMEFTRDAKVLYDELVKRIPGALGKKFDETVFGKVQKPGDNFDTFANVEAQSLASDVYGGLVEADTDISIHNGIVNGYAMSPQGKSVLLKARDENGRPIFINNVSEGAVPVILGAPTYMSKGVYAAGSATTSTPETLGYAGDWTQALYGTVEGIDVSISDQASIVDADGNTINLWQQNMVAVRAEIEIGFRADTSVFNKLTGDTPSA